MESLNCNKTENKFTNSQSSWNFFSSLKKETQMSIWFKLMCTSIKISKESIFVMIGNETKQNKIIVQHRVNLLINHPIKRGTICITTKENCKTLIPKIKLIEILERKNWPIIRSTKNPTDNRMWNQNLSFYHFNWYGITKLTLELMKNAKPTKYD